jgi:hypothetical protein
MRISPFSVVASVPNLPMPSIVPGESLRVLTINLWMRHAPWSARHAALVRGLRQSDPDGVFASDHVGVVADLVLPPSPADS